MQTHVHMANNDRSRHTACLTHTPLQGVNSGSDEEEEHCYEVYCRPKLSAGSDPIIFQMSFLKFLHLGSSCNLLGT